MAICSCVPIARIACRRSFDHAGVDSYFLQRAINGQPYSVTVHASTAYDFPLGFRLVLTGMTDVTPFVERRFEFIARLAYNVVRRFHEVRP